MFALLCLGISLIITWQFNLVGRFWFMVEELDKYIHRGIHTKRRVHHTYSHMSGFMERCGYWHIQKSIAHCRIHWLHLCRGVRPRNEFPGYDTKQSDGEAPVILELWGMWNTASMLLLPVPLRPRVLIPDRVLSMGQIELKSVLMLNWIT